MHNDYDSIPKYMKESIEMYINKGIQPGQFLQAVICNDLKEAIGRADKESINLLPTYVSFFYNEAPSCCWGSKENFKNWKGVTKC